MALDSAEPSGRSAVIPDPEAELWFSVKGWSNLL